MVGIERAFAAVKVDGSVVTWGGAEFGGDSRGVAEQLSSGMQTVVGNSNGSKGAEGGEGGKGGKIGEGGKGGKGGKGNNAIQG